MTGKPNTRREENAYCSFCGKSQHDTEVLVAGPKVFICDECVGLCNGIIFDRKVVAAMDRLRAPPVPPVKPPSFLERLLGRSAA